MSLLLDGVFKIADWLEYKNIRQQDVTLIFEGTHRDAYEHMRYELKREMVDLHQYHMQGSYSQGRPHIISCFGVRLEPELRKQAIERRQYHRDIVDPHDLQKFYEQGLTPDMAEIIRQKLPEGWD